MDFSRRTLLGGMLATPAAAVIGRSGLARFEDVTVFEASKIITMERGLPQARFIAVSDGMILGLGQTRDDLAVWTHNRRVKLDRSFADKVLFPGLIDPHIHPMQAAVMLGMPFLAPDSWDLPTGHFPGVTGQDKYRAQLKRMVDESTADPVIIWGHHELFHGPLNRKVLDEIAPNRPLFVWQRSFHEIFANSEALKWMKLSEQSAFDAALAAAQADPAHGDLARGIFSESALAVALAKLRSVLLSPQKLGRGFAGLAQMMRERGVTSTSDLATGIFADFDTEAGLIARAFGGPDSMARVNLMPIASALDSENDLDAWLSQRRQRFTSANVSLRKRVKLFADGAFFAQNMQMGPPGYSDGHEGKWLTKPEVLARQMQLYWRAGFSLHIHVNGDRGAEVVLDGLAKLPPSRAQSIVLEHLGYCTQAQINRIARMGLMVSAQPNYIRVLAGAYARKGFGADRASLMNRLGSLEKLGVPLGLHSDFNMAPIDPFYLAWIAQTREGIDGVVRAPAERLSREKALRAITVDAARLIGADRVVGSLAAGKSADFIALDVDPHKADIARFKSMPIHATCFAGKVVRHHR